MSTSNIVPNQSTPSNYVEQASQNPPSNLGNIVKAPADQGPVNGPSRLNNVLLRIASPTPPPATPQVQPASTTHSQPANNTPPARPAWETTLGKVASVGSTGLAGIPD